EQVVEGDHRGDPVVGEIAGDLMGKPVVELDPVTGGSSSQPTGPPNLGQGRKAQRRRREPQLPADFLHQGTELRQWGPRSIKQRMQLGGCLVQAAQQQAGIVTEATAITKSPDRVEANPARSSGWRSHQLLDLKYGEEGLLGDLNRADLFHSFFP